MVIWRENLLMLVWREVNLSMGVERSDLTESWNLGLYIPPFQAAGPCAQTYRPCAKFQQLAEWLLEHAPSLNSAQRG